MADLFVDALLFIQLKEADACLLLANKYCQVIFKGSKGSAGEITYRSKGNKCVNKSEKYSGSTKQI